VRPANEARAREITLGETRDQGSIRIHRWSNGFEVTELANAGKRGKRCASLRVFAGGYNVPHAPADGAGWDAYGESFAMLSSMAEVKAFLADVLARFPSSIRFSISEKRGIDVAPAGKTRINLRKQFPDGTIVEVDAEPGTFSVTNSVVIDARDEHGRPKAAHGFRQDTHYYATNKSGAQKFYAWVEKHMLTAQNMTIADFRRLWDEQGIGYDFH
jgi:hypothetical protein